MRYNPAAEAPGSVPEHPFLHSGSCGRSLRDKSLLWSKKLRPATKSHLPSFLPSLDTGGIRACPDRTSSFRYRLPQLWAAEDSDTLIIPSLSFFFPGFTPAFSVKIILPAGILLCLHRRSGIPSLPADLQMQFPARFRYPDRRFPDHIHIHMVRKHISSLFSFPFC